MTFAAACVCAALASMPFGLLFLVFPEQVSGQYGIAGFNGGTVMLVRLLGVSLLFIGASTLAVRATTDTALQRRFSGAYACASLVAVAVSIHAALTGAVNALGWSTVLIYAAFTLAWTLLALAGRH